MARWTPSKSKAREFAKQMDEINNFCNENGISQSRNQDSYYFTLNGQQYRVSNHSIESSNLKAYNWLGEKVRNEYHDNERNENIVYIHASKTRIIEIYNNLKRGCVLDSRGNIVR